MTITLRYFAILREQRGLAEERLELSVSTAGELYDTLQARHGFSLGRDRVRVAVNGEFASWSTVLSEGDILVFIPPVAGG